MIIKDPICYPTAKIIRMSGGGNMKRSIKLISVILTAAMLMSFASCAKRRTGAERIKSDSEAKQEAGLETGFTDPTDTAPTDTEPTDTTPTETAPTQTDPLPTISATPAIPDNSTNTGSQADGTNTAAYLFISGILFTAGDLNTTKYFIESSFGTTLGDPISTDKSATSPSYTAYTFECKIVVDGVEFNNVEIDVVDSTGAVYQTSFINNKENADTLKGYQKQFADKLSICFSSQLTDKSSGNVTSQVHALDSGLCMESGCLIDGSKDSFWVSFYNESLLK